MKKRILPRVKIPDLDLDELKRVDPAEVSSLANKMRRSIIDEDR
jgi:ABC-type transporter Mla MlaB component